MSFGLIKIHTQITNSNVKCQENTINQPPQIVIPFLLTRRDLLQVAISPERPVDIVRKPNPCFRFSLKDLNSVRRRYYWTKLPELFLQLRSPRATNANDCVASLEVEQDLQTLKKRQKLIK